MTKSQLTKLALLLNRIRNATAQRGMKQELASFLGTSPQHLSAWLAGTMSPSGEVTLLMLEWVTAEEAKQQNTVPVLRTPTRRMTRSTIQANEKKKRVRKK